MKSLRKMSRYSNNTITFCQMKDLHSIGNTPISCLFVWARNLKCLRFQFSCLSFSGSQSGVKSCIKKTVQDSVWVRCLQGGVIIHVTFKYLCGVWNYHKVDNQPKYWSQPVAEKLDASVLCHRRIPLKKWIYNGALPQK